MNLDWSTPTRASASTWAGSVAKGQEPAAVVVEYVRFGVPVDIDFPDDDEVFDATDVTVDALQQQLD